MPDTVKDEPKVGTWVSVDDPKNWDAGSEFVQAIRKIGSSGHLKVLPLGNDRFQLTLSPPEANRDQITVEVISYDTVQVTGYIMPKDGLDGLKSRIKEIVEVAA